MLSSVDSPQPVGPTTDTNSPRPMTSVVSRTAVYAAAPALRAAKVTVMFSSVSAASVIGKSIQKHEPALDLYRLLAAVFLQRPVGKTVVEGLRQIDFRLLHFGHKLVQHLVDVLRALHRETAVWRETLLVLVQADLVDTGIGAVVLGRHGGNDVVDARRLQPQHRAHHRIDHGLRGMG